MMNFQKLLDQKLENLRGQTRLLRRHLTANLCNLGWCSRTPELYNDASFSFGTMFGWFGWWNEAEIAWKRRWALSTPPHSLDEPKIPPWLGLNVVKSKEFIFMVSQNIYVTSIRPLCLPFPQIVKLIWIPLLNGNFIKISPNLSPQRYQKVFQ